MAATSISIKWSVCTYNYDSDCNRTREGLLTLCAGQQTCAANGLRKLISACKNKAWSTPYVMVNYSCIPDDMIIRECHGDDVTGVRRREAVILSPDYTGKNRDALDNHSSWSFHVPMWKGAVLTIHQLTSRRTLTTFDQALLHLRYPVCNGGGMKTEKFCGLLNTEEKRRVCGMVVILGRGFDHRYEAGTRFMLSFKELVLSLVLSGVVIVILLTAVIVVCYRTKQLEKLKYGSDSTSRRRSRESSSARFDSTGSSRPGRRSGGGSSIEDP